MVIAAHLIDPELQRVFSEELPELRYADASAADRPAFADFRAFLERSTVGVPDRDLAMWMVATVSNAVIHRAVIERGEDLSSGAITGELVTLLVRYLQRGRPRNTSSL